MVQEKMPKLIGPIVLLLISENDSFTSFWHWFLLFLTSLSIKNGRFAGNVGIESLRVGLQNLTVWV